MIITVLGSKAPESLEHQMVDSLRHLNHQPTLISIEDISLFKGYSNSLLKRFINTYDQFISKELAKAVVALNPDLVIIVYRTLHPIIIHEFRRLKITAPIVQYNPDALTSLDRQQIIGVAYDFYFSKDRYLVKTLRNMLKFNAYYMPESFNPRFNKKPYGSKKSVENEINVDVLAYGTLYPYRTQMLNRIAEHYSNVRFYGRMGHYTPTLVKSAFTNRPLMGDEKNEMLYGSKIVFNNLHYGEFNSANQKYFEIFGSGGFQLCDFKEVLREYSLVPIDNYTFKTIDEAIEKVEYYLNNEAKRMEISSIQHEYFLQNHTLDQRMQRLIELTGKEPKAAKNDYMNAYRNEL